MKVLIIGLGSIAIKHIEAIKKINQNAIIYALRSSNNANNFKDIIISKDKLKKIKIIPVEFITEAVKTPVPVILISFVQTRPFEIIDPVVFVVIFQNPVHPVKVGFTDPLKILDTVMEGKVH